MANILDGICPEGSILDGFDDWPRSATRKEWFAITRGLIQQTIANDLNWQMVKANFTAAQQGLLDRAARALGIT